MRQCTKCKTWKDKCEFYTDRKGKDKLSSRCIKCLRDYARNHYRKISNVKKRNLRFEERHRVIDGVKQKRCSRCRKWKSENEFYKNRALKDGLAVWCKQCADKATNECRDRRLAIKN